MGRLQRILKNLGALLAGRLVSVIQQVVVPPVFIARYGLSGFGEWGALSGAVAALGMLNFGVQTYMNQDLAIRVQRGEDHGAQVRQSTALRLLCAALGVAALLLLGLFAVPFDRLLRLDMPRSAAQWTLYLLAMQVLATVPFGYFGGIFLGVNRAHRGSHWNNVQSLVSSVGLLVGVALHLSFPVLAAIQLGALMLCMAGVLLDLRRSAPQLFPSLRYWDRAALPEILRGSGAFGLIEMSTFLTYQAPLLVMQRLLGPAAVGGFVLMRTVFSMCRQLLAMVTQSMGAEITALFGRRDWPALRQLYTASERVVFFLIALINLTVLMASPALIALWIVRRPGHGGASLFAVTPFVLCAAVSMVVSLKEHKQVFQLSTNTHSSLAWVTFLSYVAMVAVSAGTVRWAGVVGFLWTWLAAEALQTAALIAMNRQLFAQAGAAGNAGGAIDAAYVPRLLGLGAAGLATALASLPRTSQWGLWAQAAVALAAALAVAAVGCPLFGVASVLARLRRRWAQPAA